MHAIQTYHQFLANGKPFTILSDHCSLKFFEDLRLSTSPKLVRYSLLLQTFNFDVVHIKGKSNVLAGFLSRYPIEEDSRTTKFTNRNQILLKMLIFFTFVKQMQKHMWQIRRLSLEISLKRADGITEYMK
jgi:hypothetical protein